MRIRYSPPSQLEIRARENELRELARALSLGSPREFSAEQDRGPAPYQVNLRAIQVAATGGPAEIEVRGTDVSITGSQENLKRLAKFVQSAIQSDHSHFEWFAGNAFIAETSVPL